MRTISLVLLFILNGWLSFGQDLQEFLRREMVNNGDTLRYRILEPVNKKPGKKYPLIVFLHGSGERGNDNEKQLTHGGKLFVDSANRAAHPAYIIFPQCPGGQSWARFAREGDRSDSLGGLVFKSELPPTRPLEMVSMLLDSIVASGSVRKNQVYIGGLSLGGFGTFEMLWRKPNFFAAAFPICGGGDPLKTKEYKKLPMWIFHGDMDEAVRVGNSRLMAGTLKAKGSPVKYSEYPGVNHNSWDNAFAEPSLLDWIFKQKK